MHQRFGQKKSAMGSSRKHTSPTALEHDENSLRAARNLRCLRELGAGAPKETRV
jgi:hypothetical protein